MSPIEVNGSSSEQLHLFLIDLPAEAIGRFTVQAGAGEWPLKYALGADALNASFVDVVDLNDLGTMPLTGYMQQAYNATGADFQKAALQIDALEGHVVLLPAQAFDHVSQTLTVSPPLVHVGSFSETKAPRTAQKLTSKAALGTVVSGPSTRPVPTSVLLLGGLVMIALLAIILTLYL